MMDRLLSICLVLSIVLHLLLLKGIPFAFPKYTLKTPIEVDLKFLSSTSPVKKLQGKRGTQTKPKSKKKIVKTSITPKFKPKPVSKPKPKLSPRPKPRPKPKSKPKSKPEPNPKPRQLSQFNFRPKPEPLKELPNHEETSSAAKPHLDTSKTQPEISVSPTLAQVSKVNSVPKNSSGAPLSNHASEKDFLKAYLANVRLQIERHKEYPLWARRYGIEGKVIVAFSLKRNGQLEGLKIEKSSGYSLLDKAALKTIRSSAPFPAFPSGLNKNMITLQIPIYFHLE
ncbi:MAG: energy transducer TonB [Candidatus Desulfofervidaceae bacterium]|nr:energy transducer TonB [Candidatus Desulfofervidaceae bacterium]